MASNRLYIELGRLARESQAVMAGEFGEVLPELLQASGSPGGARPKVLAGVRSDDLVTGPESYPDGYESWLIKFFARVNPPDTGAVEEAYACMAQAAGIAFPDHRLFEVPEGRFFGVRRFDRVVSRPSCPTSIPSWPGLIRGRCRLTAPSGLPAGN